MLYDLVQKRRGKESIVMTDELARVNDRLKTLRKGHRKGIKGQRVAYIVRPASTSEKFKQKPHTFDPSGQAAQYPPRIRK